MAKQIINTAQNSIKAIDSTAEFVVQGTRFTTTSSSFVLVPGCVMNYTSGDRPERLILTMSAMASNGATAATSIRLTLGFDSIPSANAPETYHESQNFMRQATQLIYDIPANDTVTIRVYAKQAGGGTGAVTNDAAIWMPRVTGFAIVQ